MRRAAWAVVALSLVAAGCTYGDREPGLLDRDVRSSTPARDQLSSPPRPPLPAPNPDLPVVDDRSWTSADGLQIQVRIAVHAIRRVGGATVLDWSVTPIEGPNLQPGDVVPAGFDLGLSRPEEAVPKVLLVDAPRRAVYRPLRSTQEPYHCLCTPIAASQRSLRIGVTRLLQITFPAIPAEVAAVDVSMATVPQFSQVPVLSTDRVPVAGAPTDLTRPAETGDPAATTAMFRYGAGEQVFRLGIHRVIAGTSFTSLEWQIISVTGGRGLETASTPPFAQRDARPGTSRNPIAASGPTLRVPGSPDPLRNRLLTTGAEDEPVECLCTDLRGWPAVLRRPDKVATVVTNYPALPSGTKRVEVAFPGHPSIPVVVSRAAAGDLTVLTTPVATRRWRFVPTSPATGWEAGDWPTPVPEQLESYDATIDRLLR